MHSSCPGSGGGIHSVPERVNCQRELYDHSVNVTERVAQQVPANQYRYEWEEEATSRGHEPTNQAISRQLGHGDVDSGRLITASNYLHRGPSLRDLSKSLRQMLPYKLRSEGKVRLPTSEYGQANDFLAESDPSSTKHSRKRQKRRYQIILSALALSLLAVVIYGVNVQRSWAALEDNWTVSSQS